MGLDDVYDYGINSPLDYSSEEDSDFGYYHPQPEANIGFRSLWSNEAEPIQDYETQLSQLKDQQNHSDQRLVKLESLVTELDLTKMKEQVHESDQNLQNLEKIVSDLKKPCFIIGTELVVGMGVTLLVLVMFHLMFNQ